VTCQGSVPQALTAFFETNGLEEAIRAAVSLGGDADTQAAIAGSAAGADGYLTPTMRRAFQRMLPAEMHQVIEQFRAKS
jgi:ADP-ribosylglycohydrolase